MVTAEIEGSGLGVTVAEDDTTAGVYLRVGFLVPLGDGFRMGVDAKILRGTDVSAFGVSGDVDYDQFGLVFEWAF